MVIINQYKFNLTDIKFPIKNMNFHIKYYCTLSAARYMFIEESSVDSSEISGGEDFIMEDTTMGPMLDAFGNVVKEADDVINILSDKNLTYLVIDNKPAYAIIIED